MKAKFSSSLKWFIILKESMRWPVTSMPGGVRTYHGNFYCSLPGVVCAQHGLYRARAFKIPATFDVVPKSHWIVQWFIQANQKTSPSSLLINNDATRSTHSDSNCIFLRWIKKILTKKWLFPKFQLIPIFLLQEMHDCIQDLYARLCALALLHTLLCFKN